MNAYEGYPIEKINLISQSSEGDIGTKKKKIIELKKGGNLDEISKNEINKIEFKRIPFFNQEESKNEIKQQKEKQDKLIRIKSRLNNLDNFSNLIKKRKKKDKIQKNYIQRNLKTKKNKKILILIPTKDL